MNDDQDDEGGTPLDTDDNAVVQADVEVAKRLTRHRDQRAVKAAAVTGEILDQPPLLGLCGAVTAWGLLSGDRDLARTGGHMLASVLLATWIKGGAKLLVSRPRPNHLEEAGGHEVRLLGPNEGPWNSFPSGHTAGGVAAARALARHRPEAGALAYAAVAALVVARLPQGGHYPLDLAAGALIGLAAEAAVARVSPPA